MQKVTLVAVWLLVFGLSSLAYGQGKRRTHNHTVSEIGSNEAQAQANAEAAVDAYVDNFEAGLEIDDFVIDVFETGSWDATSSTYTITFVIIWQDTFPAKQAIADYGHVAYEISYRFPLFYFEHPRGAHLPTLHRLGTPAVTSILT